MSTTTAESVTRGHPDKVADQISDAILDEYLRCDPHSRVAVETLVKGNQLVLAGEVRSDAMLSQEDRFNIAQRTLAFIGYPQMSVTDLVAEQSSEIACAVDGAELGAGDQGIMYGYATSETPERLPLSQVLARDLTDALTGARESGHHSWLHPDGKAQVTCDGRTPMQVVVSTCHDASIGLEDVRSAVLDFVAGVLGARGIDASPMVTINPAGAWTLGGPAADAGLTGRKLMVDSYGGIGRHGGGAFSGKDPSKVDRSAAYAARQAAKWLVDDGMAASAQVSLAYAIGESQPVMVDVLADSTHRGDALQRAVLDRFDFRPAAIIERLDLLRPIYEETAARGHFGRPGYSWENTHGLG